MAPDVLYALLYRVATSTPCIPVFEGDQCVAVEPLTHEEATVLCRALTVHLITSIERNHVA